MTNIKGAAQTDRGTGDHFTGLQSARTMFKIFMVTPDVSYTEVNGPVALGDSLIRTQKTPFILSLAFNRS